MLGCGLGLRGLLAVSVVISLSASRGTLLGLMRLGLDTTKHLPGSLLLPVYRASNLGLSQT